MPLRTGLLLLTLFAVLPVWAQETPTAVELEEQIRAMEQEIRKYKEMLKNTQDESSDIEKDLENSEKSINTIKNKIREIETDLETGEDKITLYREEQSELTSARTEQQHYIEKQMQAAYRTGKQEYFKVVLNQEDPNQITRMLTYYDYLNRARAREVTRYSETITRLDEITLRLARENEALAENRTRLAVEQSQLLEVQTRKQQTLAQLKQDIARTGDELQQLNRDRSDLEQLLSRIDQHSTELPYETVAIPFPDMKGQLLLPVEGSIAHTFGSPRNIGKVRWSGVFIEADAGEPVYAVHYGRVVFADWLRGFGLLLIISHGDGYMSLYGHNETIFRDTGDWVVAGEPIATVGDTGGQVQTGLYFEIRINGEPADPKLWCQTRGKQAA